MRSMTGSGQASGENRRHAVVVDLRSVNHRMLDLQLRLDEGCRASEPELRELLGRELARGRVEARVDLRSLEERRASVDFHMGVVRAASAAAHQLFEEGLVTAGLTAGDLLRIPEALRVDLAPEPWDEADHELLLGVAASALAQLVASRELEGGKLAAALASRLDALETVVGRLDALRGTAREEGAAALRRRLAELLEGQPVDPARLAQEAAVLADRSDVTEEIDRLRSHVEHFRAVAGGPEASGKRLDFLTQEVFRELNTLGAKCRNAEMVRGVLDAKVLCEQIREQVQNVE